MTLAVSSTALLYLLSVPLISVGLTRLAEQTPPLTPAQLTSFAPQAIVILGGGAVHHAPEYGGATVANASSLQRTAYAAYLAKSTGLPVLVSGGYGNGPTETEAFAMRSTLEGFGVDTKWLEDRSRNTKENAAMSVEMLRADHVSRVLLVTGATHARRATRAFEKADIEVLAAPTGFSSLGPREQGILALVPTAGRFHGSNEALRALLAEVWYRLTGS